MNLTGEEFYKQFYCRFQEFANKDRGRYNKTVPDPEWTKYVVDQFLPNVGKQLGYTVEPQQVFGVDILFSARTGEASIAIEHENDPVGIWEDEVPNLLKTAAPLKVLITYVRDTEFPGKEIMNRLYDKLKERNFGQEFLLILGSYSMKEPSDWVGYLYHSKLDCQTLSMCSNMLEVEERPGHKAWKTRKTRKWDSASL